VEDKDGHVELYIIWNHLYQMVLKNAQDMMIIIVIMLFLWWIFSSHGALIGHLVSARRICSCAMRSFSWNGAAVRNPDCQ
jgi:hypothetical protein